MSHGQNSNLSAKKSRQSLVEMCSKGIYSLKKETDEYIGIEYRDELILEGELNLSNLAGNNRKSVDGDFRVKYKTEICKFWELNKECRYGNNCAFAHGYADIRNKATISSNYKTKKCKQFYDNGYCPYGARCQFLHSQILLRSNSLDSTTITPTVIPEQSQFSYKKRIQRLLSLESVPENSPSESTFFIKRPRLQTFSQITNDIIGKEFLTQETCDEKCFSITRKSLSSSENSYSTSFFSRRASDDCIIASTMEV